MRGFLIGVGLAVLGGQPALAATDFRDGEANERRSGLFAAAHLAVPLGTARLATPAAGLRFGAAHSFRGAHAATAPRDHGAAIVEYGLRRGRSPRLAFAGQDMAEIRERLGLDSTTTALAVAGGIAVVALIAVAAGGGGGGDDLMEAPPVGSPP